MGGDEPGHLSPYTTRCYRSKAQHCSHIPQGMLVFIRMAAFWGEAKTTESRPHLPVPTTPCTPGKTSFTHCPLIIHRSFTG